MHRLSCANCRSCTSLDRVFVTWPPPSSPSTTASLSSQPAPVTHSPLSYTAGMCADTLFNSSIYNTTVLYGSTIVCDIVRLRKKNYLDWHLLPNFSFLCMLVYPHTKLNSVVHCLYVYTLPFHLDISTSSY